MLKILNISKKFENLSVLNNITLTIDETKIVGLAGPSGGGKSTLLRCIQGLETADSGFIDNSLTTGFMFQDFQLFPHMSVLNNLIYAPSIEDKLSNHEERALLILDDLGLKDKAHAYPKTLSGGQKQRVALARSLMMKPQLLLCDEPTSGLDVATIEDVISLLESIREKGVMMIIASHDLDFLTQIASRIIILKEGQVAFDINPKELNDPINTLKAYY